MSVSATIGVKRPIGEIIDLTGEDYHQLIDLTGEDHPQLIDLTGEDSADDDVHDGLTVQLNDDEEHSIIDVSEYSSDEDDFEEQSSEHSEEHSEMEEEEEEDSDEEAQHSWTWSEPAGTVYRDEEDSGEHSEVDYEAWNSADEEEWRGAVSGTDYVRLYYKRSYGVNL